MTIPVPGINTYGYIWSTPAADCVRRLAELGYRSFELLVHPPHLPLDDFDAAARRQLASVLHEVGAQNCSLNLPSLDHNLASPLPRVRAASVQMFHDAIDLACDLGICWLVTVPGRMSPLFPPSMADRSAWMRDSIEALLPHAETRGVKLAIENVPIAAFPDAQSLGAYVRAMGSDALGVCYDVANAHFIGEQPHKGLQSLADLLGIVHLSDTARDVWRHDTIGTGTVPFADVADALASIGFSGMCMLEIINADPEAAILKSHDELASRGLTASRTKAAA